MSQRNGKYYSLVTFNPRFGEWGVQFGDWDRNVVIEEEKDSYSDIPACWRKIIWTDGTQEAIDAQIAKMNAAMAKGD